MALRYYANAPERALTAPVLDSVTTSIQVDSIAGWPTQFPFTIIIDPDGVLEEACDVLSVLGTTLTVTRGVDSTLASAHAAGVKVVHGVTARDLREANSHVNSTADTHGITGSFVGTGGAQTITGQKNFTGGLQRNGSEVVDLGSAQNISGVKNFINLPTTSSAGAFATTGSANNFVGANTFSSDPLTVNSNATFTGTVATTNATMRPNSVSDTTDDSTTSSTFTAGAAAVGTTFAGPPSGKVLVIMSAYFGQTTNTEEAIVSYRIGTGTVLGGGSESVSPSGDRSLVCGMAVNASAPARLQASRINLIEGLTPGQSYNIQAMFSTTAGGQCQVFKREFVILPIF